MDFGHRDCMITGYTRPAGANDRRGPAESAGVPIGGRVLEINGVPVHSLKEMKFQLGRPVDPVEFFVGHGKEADMVCAVFDILADADGRMRQPGYNRFCTFTEGQGCDGQRWMQHCDALGAAPEDGLRLSQFSRLFVEPKFPRHYRKVAEDLASLTWKKGAAKWMWAEAAVTEGILDSSSWAGKFAIAAAKKDPFGRHWKPGKIHQVVDDLGRQATNPQVSWKPVRVRMLVSDGIKSGPLRIVKGLMKTAEPGWFVLREGLAEGAFDLVYFKAVESDENLLKPNKPGQDPEESLQLDRAECRLIDGMNFEVSGFQIGKDWKWETFRLRADTVETAQAWLDAINGLNFGNSGGHAITRTLSLTETFDTPALALGYLQEKHQTQLCPELLAKVDASLESRDFASVAQTMRALAKLSELMGETQPNTKQRFETKQHEIAALASDNFARAEQCLQRERAAQDCDSAEASYKELTATIALLHSMGSLAAGSARDATDLGKRLSDHVDELCEPVTSGHADPATAATLIARIDIACRCTREDHFQRGNQPSVRLAKMWTALTESATQRGSRCATLLQDDLGGSQGQGGLMRTSSASQFSSISELSVLLTQLDGYRSVFGGQAAGLAQPTAEEGIPPQSEPESAPLVSTARAGFLAKVETLLADVGGKLRAICAALQAPTSAHLDNCGNSSEAVHELERILQRLQVYVEVDAFAAGCFSAAVTQLTQQLQNVMQAKVAVFDTQLDADPVAAEATINALEKLRHISALEVRVSKVVGSMRSKIEQGDSYKTKVRELFQSRNFVELAATLRTMKSNSQDGTSKLWVDSQTFVISQLKFEYDKGNSIAQGDAPVEPTSVAKLAESMKLLDDAKELEQVIDGQGYSTWRVELQSAVTDLCEQKKTSALADLKAWRLLNAERSLIQLRLYAQCPLDRCKAMVEQVRGAKLGNLESLATTLDAALGKIEGKRADCAWIDKVLQGMIDIEEGGLDGDQWYGALLDTSQETIKVLIEELKREWERSNLDADVASSAKSYEQLRALSRSKIMSAQIQELDIDLSLCESKLQGLKGSILSYDHMLDASSENTIGQSLSGLKSVDEPLFKQMLDDFVKERTDRKAELVDSVRRSDKRGEELFGSLQESIDGLAKCHTILTPHCGDARYAPKLKGLQALRTELLEAWTQSIKDLCVNLGGGNADMARKAVGCLKLCKLQATEQQRVVEIEAELEAAGQQQEQKIEQLIHSYRQIKQFDCLNPASFTFSGAMTNGKLEELKANADLIATSTHTGNLPGDLYQDCVRHLNMQLQQARIAALHAAEEDPANFRQVAKCAEGISKLNGVTSSQVDTAVVGALSTIKDKVRYSLQQLLEEGEEKFRDGVDSSDSRAIFQEVNTIMEALKRAGKDLKSVSCFSDVIRECTEGRLVETMKQHTKDEMKKTIAEINEMEGEVDLETVARKLLELYKVQSDINHKAVEKEGIASMNRVLKVAQDREQSIANKKISYETLDNTLTEIGAGRGAEIVSLLEAFKALERKKFQVATAGASFEKSLKELEENAVNRIDKRRKTALERCWKLYEAKYEKMIKAHFRKKDVGAMVAEAKAGAHIAELIAGIGAVWSLAGVDTDEEDSLMRPHPVQIIGIFMLLGLDGGSDALKLEGHLIQVKTGQGKSVLLGVLATTLAVNNFDVDCVCYSKYLSDRDRESFAKVFDAFGVHENVNYGTFNNLAETSINAKGNIRKLTDDVVVRHRGQPQLPAPSTRKKILLIDEVDVFFSDSFYGKSYAPMTVMRNTETDALQQFLWEQRQAIDNLGKPKLIEIAKKHESFMDLQEQYGHLSKVLDYHLQSMVESLENIPGVKTAAGNLTEDFRDYAVVQDRVPVKQHGGGGAAVAAGGDLEPEPEPEMAVDAEPDVEVSKWRIGYSDQAIVLTNIFVHYETMWLYFYEQEQENLEPGVMHGTQNPKAIDGPMDMDHALGIRIKCGEFSFAEMGRAGRGENYAHTLGVTGTLECLGAFEKRIITEDYGIKKMSEAPSIYGENRMMFAKDANSIAANRSLQIETDLEGWHAAIQRDSALRQRSEVPVVVFFENELRMRAYDKYLDDHGIQKTNLSKVSEDQDDVDFYVRSAARAGNATLFTKFHGRGTDFKVREDAVELKGGMHVLQTFLSEEEAEEIQIRGRSARQDKSGTYKLILFSDDLAKFELPAPVPIDYALLDRKRKEFTEKGTMERKTKIDEAREKHGESMEYAGQLRRGDFEQAMEFMNEQYAFVSAAKNLLFVLDYSGSMGGTLIRNAVAGMRTVFDEHVNAGDSVALTVFNHLPKIPQLGFDWMSKEEAGNEARIRAEFDKCNKPNGATSLWDAIEQALDQSPADAGGKPFWIVLLTDGMDSTSQGRDNNPHGPGFISAAVHEANMMERCRAVLIPKVQQCKAEGRLGGMIAVAAGPDLDKPAGQATKDMLKQITNLSGVADGLISEASADKLQEAFGKAAAIMGGGVGYA